MGNDKIDGDGFGRGSLIHGGGILFSNAKFLDEDLEFKYMGTAAHEDTGKGDINIDI